MHESEAKRFGELSEEEQKDMPDLPDEAHIVSGTLEGHGAVELASEKAKLSARVIKLARTDSGGIDYQIAIFASEPTPAPVPVAEQQAAEPTDEEKAVAYFVERGLSSQTAKSQVARFGVSRVLAQREKELNSELADLVSRTPPPTAAA